LHGAAAAYAVLATDMGSGEGQIVAQKIRQALSRLSFLLNGLTIDQKRNLSAFHFQSKNLAKRR
jgi:hypothetical protein